MLIVKPGCTQGQIHNWLSDLSLRAMSGRLRWTAALGLDNYHDYDDYDDDDDYDDYDMYDHDDYDRDDHGEYDI